MARIVMPIGAEFEDSEFTVPYRQLQNAGHVVVVLGTRKGEKVLGKRRAIEERL